MKCYGVAFVGETIQIILIIIIIALVALKQEHFTCNDQNTKYHK